MTETNNAPGNALGPTSSPVDGSGEVPTKMDEQEVHSMRRDLCLYRNSLPIVSGRYNSMARTSLEMAFMWLGKVLGYLGEPYPYKPGVPVPVPDEHEHQVTFLGDITDSQKHDLLRKDLQRILDTVFYWSYQPISTTLHLSPIQYMGMIQALLAASQHIQEAKFSLGREMKNLLKVENLLPKKDSK